MKITLKKIKTADIEIIQSELLQFMRYKIDNLAHCNDYQNYCNDIIAIDTLQNLFFLCRTKIEGKNNKSNFTLSPTQAVVLLFCAQWQRQERTQEQRITMQGISALLHEKLVNI